MGAARKDIDKYGVRRVSCQQFWIEYGFRPEFPAGTTEADYWDTWEAMPLRFRLVEEPSAPSGSFRIEYNQPLPWAFGIRAPQLFADSKEEALLAAAQYKHDLVIYEISLRSLQEWEI